MTCIVDDRHTDLTPQQLWLNMSSTLEHQVSGCIQDLHISLYPTRGMHSCKIFSARSTRMAVLSFDLTAV